MADVITARVQPYRAVYAPYAGAAPRGGLLFNNDITQTVYISDTEDVDAGSVPLAALAGFAYDGSKDIFVATLTGTVQLLRLPGVTQWAPSPAQISAQISALGLAKDTSVNAPAYGPVPVSYGPAKDATLTTGIALPVGAAKDVSVSALAASIPSGIAIAGVPLLSSASNLLNVGNTNVAAGATGTQGPFTITQIGYEVFISVECNAASNDPFFTVVMTWSDSVSGRTVAVEQWDLCATAGAFQQYCGTGPTKGDTLNISLANQDNVNLMTYVMSFTQNSRVYTRDDWRQLTTHTPPGFTNAAMSPNAMILGSTAASIAGNGSNVRLLSLFAGQAQVSISNGANALTFTITEIADPTAGLGVAGALVYTDTVAANGNLNATIQLPRSICAMALTNGGAGAMSPIATVTAAELLT